MNRFKRLAYSVMMELFIGNVARTRFVKKHHLYGNVGNNCLIMKRRLPLYSNLIFLHDNVLIASNVGFITHDAIHSVLNRMPKLRVRREGGFVEKVGCIEIMNNVFVGAGTRILYDTRIGNNVIIGAGSLVNKDIPDNSVYAGVPARYICSFSEYVDKHRNYSKSFRQLFGLYSIKSVDDNLATRLYKDFLSRRES